MLSTIARSVGFRLAWEQVSFRYRRPIIADEPHNSILYRLGYGSLRKTRNFARVRQAYKAGRAEFIGSPIEIRVDPTSVCNLHCPLCPTGTHEIDRSKGMMSLDTFQEVLDRHAPDVFRIKMNVWGEPLLNRRLSQMIELATQRNVGTEFSTNLSVELDDDAIDSIIHAGLTWLTVSLDGVSEETYSRYRLGGKYQLVVDNMRRFGERKRKLRSLTPFVEWQFVPFRHNEHEIPQIHGMSRRLQTDGVRIKPLRIDKVDGATFRILDDVSPIELENRSWVPGDPRLAHTISAEHPVFANVRCGFLWHQISYHHDGGLAPCCEVYKTEHDFGTLAQDFNAVWHGPTFQEARRIACGIAPTPGREQMPCVKCKVFAKPPAG